jgi:hypothetical protein
MLELLFLAVGGLVVAEYMLEPEEVDPSGNERDEVDAQMSEPAFIDASKFLDPVFIDKDNEMTAANLEHAEDSPDVSQKETNIPCVREFKVPTSVEGDIIGEAKGGKIIVDSQQAHPGGHLDDRGLGAISYEDAAFDLTDVNSGEGDHYIVVENGAARIVTGGGHDVVDAHGMTAGVIRAGSGDLVIGSDVVFDGPPGLAVVVDGAEFLGGTAAEFAVAIGDSAKMSGGGGNDILHSYIGDAFLDGGDGNDTLLGNASESRFDQSSRASSVETMSNDSSDTLVGGDGDDFLELSRGDIGTGGTGEDRFEVFSAENVEYEPATITDFSPPEDILMIQVGDGDPWNYLDPSYDLAGRVSSLEENGTTFVVFDDEIVAVVAGVTDLSIGYPQHSSFDEYGETDFYVNVVNQQVGNQISFDVIIQVFKSKSS